MVEEVAVAKEQVVLVVGRLFRVRVHRAQMNGAREGAMVGAMDEVKLMIRRALRSKESLVGCG